MTLHFAPLQGYTDLAYRLAHAAVCGGVEDYGIPFLRLEHGELRKRDLREMQHDLNTMPVMPQVIARDAEEFRTLVDAVRALGYTRVELNMGCPFPMQTRRGRGAGLLQQPDALVAICAAMRDYPDMQFAAKMRLGLEQSYEWEALLPVLESSPVSRLTVHPRVGAQQYKGTVDMEAFSRFYETCRLPLLYNGDVRSLDDIRRLEERYPRLCGVMIGRGLLERPTLALEYAEGRPFTDDEVRQRVLQMVPLVEAHYRRTLEGGEAQVRQKMKVFAEYLAPLMGKKWSKSF